MVRAFIDITVRAPPQAELGSGAPIGGVEHHDCYKRGHQLHILHRYVLNPQLLRQTLIEILKPRWWPGAGQMHLLQIRRHSC
jgi:hypothetical protein